MSRYGLAFGAEAFPRAYGSEIQNLRSMIKLKHLILMSVITTAGCGSSPQDNSFSFDDYPVYKGEWEEMVYSSSSTRFSLWAPTAQEVRVMLYDAGQGGSAFKMIPMEAAADGMWKATAEGDLNGKFYTFNVKVNDAWLGDTPGLLARAVGVNGNRAAILNLDSTDPQGWESDRRPPMKDFSDMMIYEMHHRDFSIDTVSGIRNRGKFLALTEKGTVTCWGEKTGIDHLKELGVTHVQLLPSFDFATVDETRLDRPQYNWGYDPKNYNVPEGSYSTDPYKPDVRIREFKQMVMALHQAGIRVIMDVVYNHTAVAEGSNFERTVPGYFYRHTENGKLADGSGCGNETASERAMMRRFMVESVCYWVNEYHVDGFRFDLMAIHDIETMKEIRAALDKIDPTIYVGGEGWAAKAPRMPEEQLALKKNISRLPGIAAFSDEFRDSLRGAWGDDSKGAFLIGRRGFSEGVKFGLAGGVSHPQVKVDSLDGPLRNWADEPTQMISYMSCHDDKCIVDRILSTMPGASVQEQMALMKLGMTAVFTSQGIPFIFAGDEVMRSKFGVGNSYASPDSINAIDWKNKTLYRELFDYTRGLVSMRKAHPAFHLGHAELVRKHLEFLQTPSDNVVAFRLEGKPDGDSWLNTIVVLNADTAPVEIDVPDGKYWIACRDGKIDNVNGLGTFVGNKLTVSPRSAMIVHQ